VLWLIEPLVPVTVTVYVPAGVPVCGDGPPPLLVAPPPHPDNPISSIDRDISRRRSIGRRTELRWRICPGSIIATSNDRALTGTGQSGHRNGDRSLVRAAVSAPRAVVVTEIVPIPVPPASAYEEGFTVQAVPCAGSEHETFTVEEYSKNGVTARSLIYVAVTPALTV